MLPTSIDLADIPKLYSVQFTLQEKCWSEMRCSNWVENLNNLLRIALQCTPTHPPVLNWLTLCTADPLPSLNSTALQLPEQHMQR